QGDVVLVARQALTVPLEGDPPGPRLAQPLLQFHAQSRGLRAAAPPLAPGARLNPIAAQEPDLGLAGYADVPKPRDVAARGPATVHVLVPQAGDGPARSRLGDVVHQVVAQLAARVGQPVREARAPRAQQD